jgi:hypothetical protein
MGKRRSHKKKGLRAPQRTARTTSRPHESQVGASTTETTLRRVTAPPNAAIALMVLFVLTVSIAADEYAMSPTLVTGRWEMVLAGASALVVFLATSTLTTTAYLVMFRRDTTGVRAFLNTLGTFATIGAILGTLLGLRLTLTFADEVAAHPEDHEQPLLEYVSLVGSTATVLTLVMVGLCWVRALGATKLTLSVNLGTAHVQEPWYVLWPRRIYGVLLVFGGNTIGAYAAIGIWSIVVAK